ncbi:MAG: MOP flippase family protein [Bacteroidales bacterium]|nr:MOP flippase family protein [Bacteroidales bacterium]
MSLKAKAIHGVKWTTASTIVTTLLQLLQLAILARFLDPSAFGLMALVMVVIGFSQAFLDMGISNAIIHKQQITHEQLSTLYWVNVLAGFGLFAIISALAPLVSTFYAEPELTALIIIVALTFLIQPFGQQFMVLWQKEMRFAEIARIDIVNKTVSLVVSVVLAYMGYGVYSLVYGTLAGVVSQTIQFMILGLKEHKPSFVFNIGEIKEFLGFGAYQMGERTINYFNSQIDVILIGKLLGTEALGIYSVAKQLVMRPFQVINPIVTKVAFPLMSKIQDDTIRLKSVYFKIVSMLSFVNLPIYGAIILLAPEIVHIMFGERWNDSVVIVQILSLAFAIVAIGNPIGSLLMAKGKANWGFYWNLAQIFIVPFVVYFASIFGLSAVSWSIVGLKLFFMILAYPFMIKPLLDAKISDYIFSFLPSMLITSLAFVFIYYLPIDIDNTLGELLILSLLYGLLYTAISMVFNKQITKELILLVKKGK